MARWRHQHVTALAADVETRSDLPRTIAEPRDVSKVVVLASAASEDLRGQWQRPIARLELRERLTPAVDGVDIENGSRHPGPHRNVRSGESRPRPTERRLVGRGVL